MMSHPSNLYRFRTLRHLVVVEDCFQCVWQLEGWFLKSSLQDSDNSPRVFTAHLEFARILQSEPSCEWAALAWTVRVLAHTCQKRAEFQIRCDTVRPFQGALLSFLLPVTPKQLLNSIEHSVMGGCNASAGVLLALGVQWGCNGCFSVSSSYNGLYDISLYDIVVSRNSISYALLQIVECRQPP